MARRHHYKRRGKETYEIDVTTFLNLMVVLVPFLLITAVFSRLTIVELNLPSTAGGPTDNQEGFNLEVIVREAGIELTNGKVVIASIPNKEEEFDFETLSDYIVDLKSQYPDQEAASVLMEAQIPYDYLIQVMDIVRSVEVPVERPEGEAIEEGEEGEEGEIQEYELVALFSEISVGDAP